MTGIELITQERNRQVKEEGYDMQHDLSESDNQIALAAVCYALPREYRYINTIWDENLYPPYFWRWGMQDWKPSPDNRIRELQKAGALIAAEIDRLIELSKE